MSDCCEVRSIAMSSIYYAHIIPACFYTFSVEVLLNAAVQLSNNWCRYVIHDRYCVGEVRDTEVVDHIKRMSGKEKPSVECGFYN